MARSRANDYDDKRQAILDRSAELFSAHGYDRASMNKIAEACGVSKANLYHYYKDKEGLLFDVIRFHLEELLEVVETADDPGAAPEARLRGLIAALLEAYRDADSQHNVQISSMRFLPAERQAKLKAMERDLVRIFSAAVAGVAPHLKGTKMLTPVTMSLFGMVNWHYLWFKSTGSVSRDEYADIVTRLISDGARNVLKPPAKTSKRNAAAEQADCSPGAASTQHRSDPMKLDSYVNGQWAAPGRDLIEVRSAVTGDVVAEATSGGLDMHGILSYARNTGGKNLRRLTFHQRADMLKKLAQYLTERKDQLYKLSFQTGATRTDNLIDVDGGIGTLFVYAGKGRRDLPNSTFLLDGSVEPMGKGGTFAGQHIVTSLQGVAVHINAFNFPCWGLLEKLAPALLAGVPVVSKPATVTSYVAHALARMIAESGILPEGAFQFIVGSTGDLFDHLTCQDVVSFTGSAETSEKLQRHPVIAREAVRFVAERDSLNAAILAPDSGPGTPEFDLFIKEVAKEMTVKAGQKCTAIRRVLAPSAYVEPVIEALRERLDKVVIGNPEQDNVRMGPVVGLDQRRDVLSHVKTLRTEAQLVAGDPDNFDVQGADVVRGAFVPPILLHCANPIQATRVHSVEAFGPVSTVMGYSDLEEAIALTNRGGGSLVASVYTHDPKVASNLVFGVSSFHGRLVIIDRDCAKEQTGHGSPMPQMVHGGPGRAGGGEELGGVRSVHHYMQRTALQGSPRMLTGVTGSWTKNAPIIEKDRHPFRFHFEDLDVGQTFYSKERTITLEDIEHFAHFTGDTFYAHMDEEATKGHPFFPGRVAHGYLLLSFAAGLFVDPDPGPVLANYGLDSLRFIKPIQPGETIKVRLTAKDKSPRNKQYGEVRWDVEILTDKNESAATYELLTMNAVRPTA